MTEPTDFRCDDCGAEPDAPCLYIRPTHEPYYLVQFELKNRLRSEGFWKTIQVSPRQGQPFEETLRIYLRAYAYQMEFPAEEAERALRGLSPRWRRVGTPTKQVHNARRKALWKYYAWSEEAAMREYLGQWLDQFGSIFEESR